MRAAHASQMVIDIERTPNGFRIKQDLKTVFVIKKNAQNPELNIQQKKVDHLAPSVVSVADTNPTKPSIAMPGQTQPITAKAKPPTQSAPDIPVTVKPDEPKTLEGKFKAGLAALHPVILPTSSVWFDHQSTHKIERESLPEFFSNSSVKTPENYRNIRDKILEMFHNAPNKYLTGLSCVEKLVG
jgi:chromatin structure-remodeling complex subunit RSC8